MVQRIRQLHEELFDFRGADGIEREQGSSRRSTSGSTARARAMHRPLLLPPESS